MSGEREDVDSSYSSDGIEPQLFRLDLMMKALCMNDNRIWSREP